MTTEFIDWLGSIILIASGVTLVGIILLDKISFLQKIRKPCIITLLLTMVPVFIIWAGSTYVNNLDLYLLLTQGNFADLAILLLLSPGVGIIATILVALSLLDGGKYNRKVAVQYQIPGGILPLGIGAVTFMMMLVFNNKLVPIL